LRQQLPHENATRPGVRCGRWLASLLNNAAIAKRGELPFAWLARFGSERAGKTAALFGVEPNGFHALDDTHRIFLRGGEDEIGDGAALEVRTALDRGALLVSIARSHGGGPATHLKV
jgi:hypothetical protein